MKLYTQMPPRIAAIPTARETPLDKFFTMQGSMGNANC